MSHVRLRSVSTMMMVGLLFATLLLASSGNAEAAGFNPGNANIPGIPQGNNLLARVINIINAILTLLAIITAVVIIYGGFQYITSQGDEDGAARGKRTVLYALIGLIIIGLSAVIANFVITAINAA